MLFATQLPLFRDHHNSEQILQTSRVSEPLLQLQAPSLLVASWDVRFPNQVHLLVLGEEWQLAEALQEGWRF